LCVTAKSQTADIAGRLMRGGELCLSGGPRGLAPGRAVDAWKKG
jgi:hypothetical protein